MMTITVLLDSGDEVEIQHDSNEDKQETVRLNGGKWFDILRSELLDQLRRGRVAAH